MLTQLWVPPRTCTCTLVIDILAITEEFTKRHPELRNTMIPAVSLVGNLHLHVDATYNYSSVHFDFSITIQTTYPPISLAKNSETIYFAPNLEKYGTRVETVTY